MKTVAVGVAFVGATLAFITQPAGPQPTERDSAAIHTSPVSPVARSGEVHGSVPSVPAESLTGVVQQYCVVCHNDQLLTGNVSLQHFAVEEAPENAEIAERMIRKLRAGMMPPPGMPRPSPDTLLALVETLESNIDEASANSAPNLGVRRFQRLSRTEYERVIEDLVGLEVDAGRWLPPDVLVGSFDNAASGQRLSTTLLDAYLRAATEISRLAIGNPDAVSASFTYSNPIEVSQHAWDRLDGAPYGTRGGIVVTHDFPADGEYVFQISTLFGSGNNTAVEDLDISVDGESVATLMLEHNGEMTVPIETDPVFIRAGQHQVSAAFVRRIDGPYDDRFSPFEWSFVGGEDSRSWAEYGITALEHLKELVVTGPNNPTGVSETASREKVFTCHPDSGARARPCAESIISRLARQAYRRPITDEDMDGLMSFYDEASATDGFEVGVRTALQALLASPSFVFRLEREPEGVESDKGYRLTDLDLAGRISFLLWASAPDEELMKVAEAGRLSDPAVLEQQVDRMLADPRSEAIATRFAHQWLRLQDAGTVPPEPFLYPDYTGQLGEDMVRETQLFFDYLVRNDRGFLELFDADYTIINERLAKHYGIEGVAGEEFRRVEYPNEQRRGILGHASVLLLTSMSARTSPVLRGKWVMQVLMGTPPPPPPPSVPAFDASPPSTGGRRLTTRERMEIHRAAPVCNACHRFMDPIGLALDNYDVVGQWRIRENMTPLDTRGDFYDGTPVNNPVELVGAIMSRPIPLVRAFAANLLAYGIGRPVEYFDQPTVRAIVEGAKADDYRMSSFIKGVINSDPFQMRQTQATAN